MVNCNLDAWRISARSVSDDRNNARRYIHVSVFIAKLTAGPLGTRKRCEGEERAERFESRVRVMPYLRGRRVDLRSELAKQRSMMYRTLFNLRSGLWSLKYPH